jgi:beta-glucosidase
MDVIHPATKLLFPFPRSFLGDMKLIERSAQIAAQEASADGINWTFSLDDRDPRGEEFLKVLKMLI